MKLMTISAAVAATFVFAQSAQAREHYRHHGIQEARNYHYAHRYSTRGQSPSFEPQQAFGGGAWNYFGQSAAAGQAGGHLGGRPSAWCGWEMRQLVSSDPGPSFNLARNWARWGQAGPPGVGAVVVWPHHVGKIVGQDGGTWIVESGNDGRAVRTRPLSIAGAIAIRWG
jgi:hypothetical protein